MLLNDKYVAVIADKAPNNIARGLVGGDNNIFVMKERQVFSNIWVFKD